MRGRKETGHICWTSSTCSGKSLHVDTALTVDLDTPSDCFDGQTSFLYALRKEIYFVSHYMKRSGEFRESISFWIDRHCGNTFLYKSCKEQTTGGLDDAPKLPKIEL